MNEIDDRNASQGFSLGAVFLLIALVAVMSAQLTWLGSGENHVPQELAVATGLGGVSGLAFGLMIGLYHFRRGRGAAIGMGTGLVFGAFTGPICAVAMQYPWRTFCTALAGGIALVVCAAIYQAINGSDPVTNHAAYKRLQEENKTTDGQSSATE